MYFVELNLSLYLFFKEITKNIIKQYQKYIGLISHQLVFKITSIMHKNINSTL